MIEVKIKTKDAERLLQEVADSLTDMRPLFGGIGEMLVRSTKERFDNSRAPDGTLWPPNSPVTLARAGKDANSKKPLIGESKSLSRTIHYEAREDGVSWGSSVIYAAVQQFGARQGAFGRTSRGGPIPWGNIPPRPFIGVSDEDEDAIKDAIAEFLQNLA